MASVIRIELWSDLAPSTEQAHIVAREAAALLRRSGPAHNAEVASVSVDHVEPAAVTNAPAPAPKKRAR